jgi:hypothetical protein
MSGMVAMTIGACAVGLVLGVGLIWYLVTRGSRAATLTKADFDHEYDELVAKGEITDPDRETAWRDFDAWQVEQERERLRWEEAADE